MIRLSVVSAPRGRRLRRGALVSAGAHAVLLGLFVAWTLHRWVPVLEAPDTPATVEMVMVETKGSGESTAPVVQPTQAKSQEPPKQPAPAEAASPTPPAPQRPVKPPPAADGPADVPPPPAPAPAARTPPDSRLALSLPPPAAHPGPEIQFGGADFETNALVSGERVIPARPDTHWHNKEPVYPASAAVRGEHGAVMLLVHISPAGLTAGVDILRSSGYPALDHAAIDAVWTWRFMPAVKDGQPIPSDMPWRVVFDLR